MPSEMDQFLAQHYGNVPVDETPSDEDLQKVAAAEMFLKVAAHNGININELNDQQVDQLWDQVWQQKLAEEEGIDEEPPAPAEGDEGEPALDEDAQDIIDSAAEQFGELKESQAKFAEADGMGQIMAHSYVANLRKIAEAGGLDFLMEDKEAGVKEKWEAGKKGAKTLYSTAKGETRRAAKFITGKSEKELGQAMKDLKPGSYKAHRNYKEMQDAKKSMGRTRKGIYAGGGAAAAAGGGGAAYAASKSKKEKEKKSSADFDKVAAEFALQKLAENQWDVDEGITRLNAVLTLGPGDPIESEKVASAEAFEDAVDYRSSELLEMAGYPVDWTDTPFEKEAGKVSDFLAKAKKGAGDAYESARGRVSSGSSKAKETGKSVLDKAKAKKDSAVEYAKEHGKSIGTHAGAAAAGAAAGAGGTYAATREKKSSVDYDNLPPEAQFDLAAGELALEKAAEAGWDGDQAYERVAAVLTLGPGDPTESEKVASADTEEEALTYRACEILELAGYDINW